MKINKNLPNFYPFLTSNNFSQSSWSKGISETNLKLKIPCSKCMHQPVTSQANACTSQAYACMYCMHCPMMSEVDACSYCLGSVVLISSQIYLYLQPLWFQFRSFHRFQTQVQKFWFRSFRILIWTRNCKISISQLPTLSNAMWRRFARLRKCKNCIFIFLYLCRQSSLLGSIS